MGVVISTRLPERSKTIRSTSPRGSVNAPAPRGSTRRRGRSAADRALRRSRGGRRAGRTGLGARQARRRGSSRIARSAGRRKLDQGQPFGLPEVAVEGIADAGASDLGRPERPSVGPVGVPVDPPGRAVGPDQVRQVRGVGRAQPRDRVRAAPAPRGCGGRRSSASRRRVSPRLGRRTARSRSRACSRGCGSRRGRSPAPGRSQSRGPARSRRDGRDRRCSRGRSRGCPRKDASAPGRCAWRASRAPDPPRGRVVAEVPG